MNTDIERRYREPRADYRKLRADFRNVRIEYGPTPLWIRDQAVRKQPGWPGWWWIALGGTATALVIVGLWLRAKGRGF